MPEGLSGQAKGRRRIVPVAALLLCALLAAGLGVWQVKRLAWKEALIAHVEQVTHSAPVDGAALPAAPANLADLEYQPVALAGKFEPQATTLVKALTELGAGYWELVPLRLANGRAIWINRGFVPLGTTREAALAAIPASAQITGLLRASENKPAFLRPNNPAQDLWQTRNLPAITAKRGVNQVGTAWFVDAKGPELAGQPVPNLTVIAFPNSHLQYALTWFALSGLCLFGIALVLRQRD
jgi:surfeit locus 1 family protein